MIDLLERHIQPELRKVFDFVFSLVFALHLPPYVVTSLDF
jgi:hypothetical protein